MKNKLTYPLICCIAMMMAACSGSSNGKPMSGDKLTEYNETVTKIQTIENLLAERKIGGAIIKGLTGKKRR